MAVGPGTRTTGRCAHPPVRDGTDAAKRQDLYNQIQTMQADDAPFVYLFYPGGRTVTLSQIKDFIFFPPATIVCGKFGGTTSSRAERAVELVADTAHARRASRIRRLRWTSEVSDTVTAKSPSPGVGRGAWSEDFPVSLAATGHTDRT